MSKLLAVMERGVSIVKQNIEIEETNEVKFFANNQVALFRAGTRDALK